MASRKQKIAGITVEIGGDTSKLQSALKGTNSEIRHIQSDLRDVERLLKLDPGNTELLAQKQKLLGQAVEETKKKLETLKQANEQAAKSAGNYDAWKAKYDPLQKEITETQTRLKELKEKSAEADKQLSEGKISKEKYDQLQAELKETETRLKDLKQQVKDVDEEFGNPIPHDQYDALQREIIETENNLKSLEKQAEKSGGAFEGIAAKGEKVKEVGDKVAGVGQTLTTKVTAPIMAVGTASVAAFNDVDTGLDIIVTKTGATGEALEGLQESFKNVYGDMAVLSADAGTAIGEVATRFKLTGEELENVSKLFLEFAEINSTDVGSSIDTVDAVMKKFGVDSSHTGEVLGLLTKAGQDTGISIDTLQDTLSRNGASLKEMGFGLEESVNLLAQMEINGVDASTAMAGLKKAVQNATKEGKSADQALQETISAIRNASSETEALSIASSLFGAKGAAEMTQAIREGRFSIDDISASLSEYGNVVQTTFENTQDASDEAEIVFHNFELAGTELATAIFQVLTPALHELTNAVRAFREWFASLSPEMQQLIVKIALLVAAVGPVLLVVGKLIFSIGIIMTTLPMVATFVTGTMIPALGAIGSAITGVVIPAITSVVTLIVGTVLPAIASALVALAPFILGGLIIAGIIAGIVLIVRYVKKHSEEIKKAAEAIVASIKQKLGEIWGHIKSTFSTIRNGFLSFVGGARQWGADLITNFINGIKSMVGSLWYNVRGIAEGIRKYIGFSEPEEGPLSDFHTYAPDMMKLFIQGIKDYTPMVQSQLASAFALPDSGSQTSSGSGGREEPTITPAGLARTEPRTQTVILQVDRTRLGQVVYQLNNEETQRVGVTLLRGGV